MGKPGRELKRVVVLGAGGLLGSPLSRLLAALPGVHVDAWTHADFDITDFDRARQRLTAARPDVIFNCSAFTRVDDCETQIDRAMVVNGEAPGRQAQTAAHIGARFVHLSTDYVFDGRKTGAYLESDPTGPDAALSIYGRSKLEGERRVMAEGGDWTIVRTSWLFGPGGPNFVRTIAERVRKTPELRVVNDQRGRPTYAPDLAAALIDLVRVGASGIVHVANAEPCTWYEFACEIVRRAAIGAAVHPCTTAEFPRPARRPANSVLDTTRFETLTSRAMRPWREALDEYLRLI